MGRYKRVNKIGRRLRVWREELDFKAYQDQFGRWQEAYLIIDEADITIVATRDVRGMWGGSLIKKGGLKAVATDGRIFFQHWNQFPDDSMNPSFYWRCEDAKLWVNAEQASRHRLMIYKDDRTTIGNPNLDE